MYIRMSACLIIGIALDACPAAHAGDGDKAHTVGKDGLTLEGKVAANDPRVKVIVGDKFGQLPAKLFLVKLSAGKKYRVALDSPEIDSVLVVQNLAGKQLAWDDDSGGNLNSLLTLNVLRDDTYKIYAASLKGVGRFTLTIREDGAAAKGAPPAAIAALENQAKAHEKKGEFAQARKFRQELLAMQTKVLGPDHWQAAEARLALADVELLGTLSQPQLAELARASQLNRKAYALYQTQKYAESAEVIEEVLKIRKDVLGEKHSDYANSLENLSAAYLAQGDTAKAEPLMVKFLEVRKAQLGEKHPDYARRLNNLGGLYNERGDYVRAEPLFVKALALRKELLGEKHPDYATSLNNLGLLYNLKEDHARAEPLYLKALEIRKEVLGEKHPDYATSLNNLALLYNTQADFARAEPLLVKALEIQEQHGTRDDADYAQILNNLGLLYRAMGNFAKAEPAYLKALTIHKNALRERHPDYVRVLNNLAALYESREDNARAEPLHVAAVAAGKVLLGAKHPDHARSLHDLAFLYNAQGDYVKAEPLYREALAIKKEALGDKHPETARTMHNLGFLYASQGYLTQAEPLIVKSMEIKKATLGENHPDHALSLNNLAALYRKQGRYAEAESLQVQAIAACQIAGMPVPLDRIQSENLRVHARTVDILLNHAILPTQLATSDFAEYLQSRDRSFGLALAVLDRVRQQNLDRQDLRIDFTADYFLLFNERISLLHKRFSFDKQAQHLEEAFKTAEQGSARSFLDSLGSRANLLANVNPRFQADESQLLDQIGNLDLRLGRELDRSLDKRAPDLIGQLFEQRRAAETRLRDLVVDIGKEHPQYVALRYPRPCKLEEARACLAENEVALLFVPGRETSFIVLVEARPAPADQANGLAIIELPRAGVLAEHVAALNDLDTLAMPARVRALGREAFDAILGACKERIKDRSLVIVPNDALCFLPFELLVEADGKYLIEKHGIRYAPSLTALHLINLWKEKRAAPEVPLFAVGDPLYDTGEKVAVALREAPSREALSELVWREGKTAAFAPLVHSGREVAEIARLLGATSDYVLTGADASEAKLKSAAVAEKLARARYVHFATHGILGVDKGKQPALVLNLVGNNKEDGFLELNEITRLKLNADLVVLSACRTGQGRMARGEGVSGLARAFLYAGSKGVVCSLWSLDDRETANLMVDFYGHLQKGQPAADALREAQLTMIRAGKAPLYWAPFILIGE